MEYSYWNSWYTAWGWFLWVGIVVLMFSSFGNWGYTYRAHRRFEDLVPQKGALDILHERYAKGEITRIEYQNMKSEIAGETTVLSRKLA